jgi:hypothetical protein
VKINEREKNKTNSWILEKITGKPFPRLTKNKNKNKKTPEITKNQEKNKGEDTTKLAGIKR